MKSHRLVIHIILSTAALGSLLSAGCNDTASKACQPNTLQRCECEDGTQSMRECAADGSDWGACDCVEAPDECAGDACQDETGCCDGFACSTWYYYDSSQFEEGYCYPMCDESESCMNDEVCHTVDDLPLCLETGYFKMAHLTSTVGVSDNDSWNPHTVEFDNTTEYEEENGGETLDLRVAELSFYEYEDGSVTRHELVTQVVGFAGTSSLWFLQIVIPADTLEDVFSDEDSPTVIDGSQFYSVLLWVEYDENDDPSGLWYESILDEDSSSLTIHQSCEPCMYDQDENTDMDTEADAGSSDVCTPCDFSFDLSWFNLSAKRNFD